MIRNIITLLLLIAIVFVSSHRESATAVKPESNQEFSAISAYAYLEEIAAEPHPIGSIANHRVKDYVVETLTDLGLEVKVELGYTYTSWKPSYNKIAYVENIVATLPGSNRSAKKVMLAGHYDSVVEGPGAADDGYAVACMMETARLLQLQKRENDLVLFITDGEEYGLLGAQYHAENNDLSDIGVVLNYEARGAEGPGIAFEWSENNAWLVAEMAKCYERPIANSLSYEIYKRMPNASDFTIFREQDVPGINHAFIDGFSYYHHPQDDLDHVSMNSIQHTGENMYLAAKHFVNFDFDLQNSSQIGDATFFNFFGSLVTYPGAANIWVLIIGLMLAIGACVSTYMCIRSRPKTAEGTPQKNISIAKSILSLLSILGVIILCAAVAYGIGSLAKTLYPQYSTFYSYHYYNHEWYLIACIGSTILICAWTGRMLLLKFGSANLLVGVLSVLALLTGVIYYFAPTGAYIMMWPMMAVATAALIQSRTPVPINLRTNALIGIVGVTMLIGMWTQFSHTLFLAFSLSALPGAIIPTALTCIAGFALLPHLWRDNLAVLILGVILLFSGLIVAHITARPTLEHPLLANIFYVYDSQTNETYVATSDKYLNSGHNGHMSSSRQGRLDRHLPYSNYYSSSEISLDRYRSQVRLDTISETKTTAHLKHPKKATMIQIYTSDVSNIDTLYVNGVVNKVFKAGATGSYYSPLYGIGLDSIRVEVTKKLPKLPTALHINMKYMELPIEDKYPDIILRNGAHTTVSERIEF